MKRVVLTAGHDPKEHGAVFLDTDGSPLFVEHFEARAWVQRIALEFKALGGEPLILGENRLDLEALARTIEWVNRLSPRAEAAVEIHFNDCKDANGKHVGRGCETLYAPGSKVGKPLAEALVNAIAPMFAPNRGAHDGWLRGDRPGVIDYPGDHDGDERLAAYLIQTNCPAVIVEPDFVVNHANIRAHRAAACKAIAAALWAY